MLPNELSASSGGCKSAILIDPPLWCITSPLPDDKFWISSNAVWPQIVFKTDAVLAQDEEMTWNWALEWSSFRSAGTTRTNIPQWDASDAILNLGGAFSVTALRQDGSSVTVRIEISGVQPTPNEIQAFLTSQSSLDFLPILRHETRLRHFDASGCPLACEGGYGIAQLTNPPPTYAQVWNWQLNIQSALELFGQKRAEAASYLSTHRPFTVSQLTYESISRWNGGAYHIWNPQQGWIRKPYILSDTSTGNIGWDMRLPANQGRSESELHQRDCAQYRFPPLPGALWGYFGVCYADALLGKDPQFVS